MAANGVNDAAHLPAIARSAEDFLAHEYDYVIVGGGTAGLVIAARLSENPDVTVGVLEAGKNRLGDPLIDVPALFPATFHDPEYDWIFKTEPQKQNNNIVHHMQRGKALGGSSAINFMVYVRGSTQDFDDWAVLAQDESWNAEAMNKYMRKHQTLEPIPDEVVDRATTPFVEKNHGTSGPCKTSFNHSFLPIEHDFIKACNEATGYSKVPIDPWSGDHIGFYNTLGLVSRTGPDAGKRSYAARAYLAANADRPNLHVLCEALVSSVELDGDKATGVNFLHNGKAHTVKVSREVIVSCGAVQSPQILELSGIGDPDVLKAAGVACKIENKAVGANFQDHVVAATSWILTPGNDSFEVAHVQPEVMAEVQRLLGEKQAGPLTHIASVQGFFPYKLFATEDEQADIIASIEKDLPHLTPFQREQHKLVMATLKQSNSANLQMIFPPMLANLKAGIPDQSKLFSPPRGRGQGVTTFVCLQYPLSRGTVHIKSNDPAAHPAVDPAYLTHPADAAVLASGVKFLDKATKSSHLQGKFSHRVSPDPEIDLSDTEQAKKWVHEWCMSEYHPCGSVAMGDAVDSRLRVKGVKNLRVADASIFPNHVSGNIISAVYSVGEKAADMIKEDWDHASLSKVTK